MGFISDLGEGLGISGGGAGTVADFAPVSGEFGVGSVDYEDGRVTSSLDPKYQALVDELIANRMLSPEQSALGKQAAGVGAGFMEALQTTDPFALAEEQFKRMDAILQPGRERQASSLEARLLSQGRLGSTGGSEQQSAQLGEFELQRKGLLADAFKQAMGVQQQQAGIAQDMGAFGLSTEQAQLQRLLQSLGGATSTEAMPITILSDYLTKLTEGKMGVDQAKAEAEANKGSLGKMLGSAGRSYLTNWLET